MTPNAISGSGRRPLLNGSQAARNTAPAVQIATRFCASRRPSRGSTQRLTIRNITATGVDRFVYINGEIYSCLVYDNTATGNNSWSRSPTDFLGTNVTWNDDGLHLPGNGNCGFNNTLTGFGDGLAYATTPTNR